MVDSGILRDTVREVGDLSVRRCGVLVEIVVCRKRGDTKLLCGGKEVTRNCCVQEKG